MKAKISFLKDVSVQVRWQQLKKVLAVSGDATVFSRIYRGNFKKPVTLQESEKYLKKFVTLIGNELSCNGIILGHIKLLAKIPSKQVGEESFIFLSLTRLECIDIIPAIEWESNRGNLLEELELHLNILVFGYSQQLVQRTVNKARKVSGLAFQKHVIFC